MSDVVPRIFQEDPIYSRRSSFRPKSWTETILGFLYEGNKLARCVLKNRDLMGRDYPWAVTINFEKELPPAEIKAIWTRVCRKLKALGLVALWVREPSRSNRCHHHLVVRCDLAEEVVVRIIDEAMPDRSAVPWHKYVDRIKSQYHYARYVCKARTSGYLGGRLVADVYAARRLLFCPGLDLRKYGTIGRFWVKPKKQIWQDIIDEERRIAEGLERAGVKDLARHVFDLLGGCYSLAKIERSFGYSATSPFVQDWLRTLEVAV